MAKPRTSKLAHVANPRTITDAKIAQIAGTTATTADDPENQANVDVADKLKDDRAEAKRAIHERAGEPVYFGGQGGAAGI